MIPGTTTDYNYTINHGDATAQQEPTQALANKSQGATGGSTKGTLSIFSSQPISRIRSMPVNFDIHSHGHSILNYPSLASVVWFNKQIAFQNSNCAHLDMHAVVVVDVQCVQ